MSVKINHSEAMEIRGSDRISPKERAAIQRRDALPFAFDWIGHSPESEGSVATGFGPTALVADFPAVINLENLDGTNGFQIEGIDQLDRSGISVSSAGDLDGDGFDDVIIGAHFGDPGGSIYAGESYILFGKATGFAPQFDLAKLDGVNGFRLDGIDQNDRSGYSVSVAGDVNGDGFDDIIIGAHYADPDGKGYAGESYVVFGKGGGFAPTFELAMLDGTNGFRLDGASVSDVSAWSVSEAGDVNGDGFDDVIIGAWGADPDGVSGAGESYVVFGKSSGFAASLDLSLLDGSNGFRLDGVDPRDFSGFSVSDAGDVNGDGFDDIIIGSRYGSANDLDNAGESYVVFGKEQGFAASFDLASLDGSNGFRLKGIEEGDQTGHSVSGAGDVNGDGFDDVIVGGYRADGDGYTNSGESYVVFGMAGGFAARMALATLDGTNGFRVAGIDSYDESGRWVSSAGDVNGDGFDDIIVGAFRADPGGESVAGESYVIFGRAGAFVAIFDLETLDGANGFRLEGIDQGDHSGRSVSGAGDINGDGFDDIIIGAYGRYVGGAGQAGESYVIFGRAPSEAVERIGSTADQMISGGEFDDRLDGRGGQDTLNGSAGSDTLTGGKRADLLNGGTGADWVGYATAAEKVVADLRASHRNTNEAAGDSYVSIENLRGSAFNDALLGNDFANRIEGLAKNDLLSGRGGKDTLAGGAGCDKLKGGEGNDRFELASRDADDADRILDFASGEDRIALDGDVFGLTRVKPGQFVVGSAAGDANDRLIYDADTGKLFFDADGTGAGAKVLIATFSGLPTLSASDFVVI